MEIPPSKTIKLENGDVPAIEIEHIANNLTMLKIHDNKGEILVQATLGINECCELSCAVTNEHYGVLSDDDDDPPPRK